MYTFHVIVLAVCFHNKIIVVIYENSSFPFLSAELQNPKEIVLPHRPD